MRMAQIIELWNRFWFTKQSPLPLCVLRIFYGLLVIAYALQWLPDLANFFGPDAVVTVKALRHHGHATGFSIFFMLPLTEQLVTTTWAVLFIAAVLSTIGLFTRASLIVTLICILSFHHRNVMILHSGDSILRLIGFMLVFAPAGAMLSVDRLLRGRKDGDAEPMMDAWPLRLVQLQLTALYCQTFFGKCAGATWFDGTAVYYASRLEDFYRFSVPYVFDHMWTCQLLTWGAIGTEFALWSLIWVKELRYPVLVLLQHFDQAMQSRAVAVI